MIEILIFFFVTLFFSLISNKFNLLPNYSGEKHQSFLDENKVPLVGGILFLFSSIYFFFEINLFFCLAILFIFFIGFLSDTKFLNSPKIRIFFQTIVVAMTVYILDIQISSTRIELLDKIIQIKLLGIFFSIFCLLILINGSNFIDGLNGLLLGYTLIILFILIKLNLFNDLEVNDSKILFLFFSLSILLIFNFYNKFYLGDSGSYLIGFVTGFLLITIYNLSSVISPYFIILLVWYPCFENLFSILRKNKFKNSPIIADDKHLHQLIYFYLRKNFSKTNLYSNNLGSLMINLYNFLIMYLASTNISDTKFQVFLIFVNLVVYLFCYIYLFNFRFKNK